MSDDPLAPVPDDDDGGDDPTASSTTPSGATPSTTAEEVFGDDDLLRVISERDDYLDSLRRLQAEFENFRKRSIKQQTDLLERAGESLVDKLLPVLDAADMALGHGMEGVEPIFVALLGALEKEGLERIDPLNLPFDPTEHEAVMHEPGDNGAGDGHDPTVIEVWRFGYRWKGRLLRPAMVKVKG